MSRRNLVQQRSLAALTLLAAVAGSTLHATRTNAQVRRDRIQLPGHVPAARLLARKLGAVPAGTRVDLALTLPLRRQAELNDLIARIYRPGDPQYGRYLSADQFAAQFSPTPEQYTAVAAFAQAQGLTVTATHSNRLLLEVAGSAAQVQQAFGTRLSRFQARDGRTVLAPETEPTIPAVLAGTLTGVVGLDDLAVRRPHLRRLDPAAAPRVSAQQSGTGPGGSLTPSDIRAAYNLTGTPQNGSGQVLGLFELDGYYKSDITTYETTFGLGPVTLQNVRVSGATGKPGSGADEVTLDIELEIALAPKASKIMVYQGPNTNAGVLATYNRIATDNLAKSISTSWGLAETQSSPSVLQSERAIFQQMEAQGQSIFAAAGDAGAFDDLETQSVDDPASQPSVTGVGGTRLTTSGPGGTYVEESTWNEGSSAHGAGGGGISQTWARPDYQNGLANDANGASSTARNVPDVALNAAPETGYAIYSGGRWVVFGGTSCAASLWAGFTALVNQQRAKNGVSTVGFLNRALYALDAAQQFTDLHDIADGSTNLVFPAVTGYDNATGLGSFNGANLLADLASNTPSVVDPALSNCTLTPTSLPAKGGAVSVSVDVQTSSSLSSVTATATPDSGKPVTVTLTRVHSSNTFIGQLKLPANTGTTPVSYDVTVSATTVVGNTNSNDCGTVTLPARDLTGPTFTNCTVNPTAMAAAGGTVALSANATDPSGIASIVALVTSRGKTTKVTLNPDGTGTYGGNFLVPANKGASAVSYTVAFRATDTFGNSTTQACDPVTAAAGDHTAPVIRKCRVSPTSLPSDGGTATITASVTDDLGVSSVVANVILKADGTEKHVTLTLTSGSTYTGTFEAPANPTPATQTYTVTLRAMDEDGNSANTPCGSFTVAAAAPDRARPTVSHCSVSPATLPADGGTITVTATVTDNVGATTVTATIKKPDGTTDTVALDNTSGNTWSATYDVPANSTQSNQSYRVSVIAADAAVNTRAVNCGTVTVRHP